MPNIKFGPSGLGGVKEAIFNLEKYRSMGLEACEISFTQRVYIKNKEDALKIGMAAKNLGISLSIHAPYWINLNSSEDEKVKKSKERILECCKVGTWLKANKVVFHPDYYGGRSKQETYENIRQEILELQTQIREKKYTSKLAPETTGKINVFGSIDEISQLVNDTKCSFCIDFAHLLARYKDYKFKEVFEKFNKHKKIHIHFSGIEYNNKGERNHKKTSGEDLRKLISNLPRQKDLTIVNESPYSVQDSILGVEVYNEEGNK
ncbi:MAG: TIM barrel protein [archaeon]